MTSPIPVCVVIVNYRSAARTLTALESLQPERRHSGLELTAIVIENDSGDAEQLRDAIEDRMSDFATLVVSPTNLGFGAGNNLGVATARKQGLQPRYWHFLNPDTLVRRGAILELVSFLEQRPKVGLASGSFETEDGSPWPFAFRYPGILSEFESTARLGVISRLLAGHAVARTMGDEAEPIDWPSGASMMIRDEALREVGGFDERFFLYFEEIDLCRRLDQAGWQRWYVPSSRIMHVCGASTGVTSLDTRPRRVPAYWFESRRHYFLKHQSIPYTLLVDAAAVAGTSLGMLKDRLKRSSSNAPPHFIRDLLQHSPLWPSNRARHPEIVPHGEALLETSCQPSAEIAGVPV